MATPAELLQGLVHAFIQVRAACITANPLLLLCAVLVCPPTPTIIAADLKEAAANLRAAQAKLLVLAV